jgi:hypothetical protein
MDFLWLDRICLAARGFDDEGVDGEHALPLRQ